MYPTTISASQGRACLAAARRIANGAPTIIEDGGAVSFALHALGWCEGPLDYFAYNSSCPHCSAYVGTCHACGGPLSQCGDETYLATEVLLALAFCAAVAGEEFR